MATVKGYTQVLYLAASVSMAGALVGCQDTPEVESDNVPSGKVDNSVPTSQEIESGEIESGEIAPDSASLIVHRTPSCGCCGDWVDHIKEAGIQVSVQSQDNLDAVKSELNIEPQYQSCHTAVSETHGYFIEGHVPANIIKRFLTEAPEDALGITVPAMPVGSPGMEMDDRFQPYDVYLIKSDGSAVVYASVKTQQEQYE